MFDAGDMNLFRYCGDDPVDRSDPMGLEDIAISSELDRLGIQASVNSRQSFIDHPAGLGSRGQLIQANNNTHSLSLQSSVIQGYVVPVYGPGRGSHIQRIIGHKVIEYTPADKGFSAKGFGHAHDDLNRASPKFSQEDWAAAPGKTAKNGKPGVVGKPVWKMLTSDPNSVIRLTPQTVPGQRPAERPLSARAVQPTSPPPPIIPSPRGGFAGPSAADVDASHQATGVPSMAAEATNFAPGKP